MRDSPEKIASLIQSLHHPDRGVTRKAADALVSIAGDQPELALQLEELLAESSADRRWPIAFVLARLSDPSPLCVRVLLDHLGSKDRDIRWAAARLLVGLCQRLPDIRGYVEKLARQGNSIQRRMSLYCLREIDPNGAATLGVLLDALEDHDALTRIAAVTSMGIQEKAGQEAINAILRIFLNDPDARVRCAAAFAMAALSPFTERIHRALKEAQVQGDPQIRKAVAAALKVLEKKGPAGA